MIFVEEKVVLILNGRVILRYHENSALEHKILGVYSSGSVLGYSHDDEWLSCNSNSWIICKTKQVYYIEMDDKTYEKIVKLSKVREKEIDLLIHQHSLLFKGLFPFN